MSRTSDYNQRQYELMVTILNAYNAQEVSLGSLIASLEGLLNALQNVPEDWYEAFWDQWAILEQIHAVSLDEQRRYLEVDEQIAVKEAIQQLQLLIARALNV